MSVFVDFWNITSTKHGEIALLCTPPSHHSPTSFAWTQTLPLLATGWSNICYGLGGTLEPVLHEYLWSKAHLKRKERKKWIIKFVGEHKIGLWSSGKKFMLQSEGHTGYEQQSRFIDVFVSKKMKVRLWWPACEKVQTLTPIRTIWWRRLSNDSSFPWSIQ